MSRVTYNTLTFLLSTLLYDSLLGCVPIVYDIACTVWTNDTYMHYPYLPSTYRCYRIQPASSDERHLVKEKLCH